MAATKQSGGRASLAGMRECLLASEPVGRDLFPVRSRLVRRRDFARNVSTAFDRRLDPRWREHPLFSDRWTGRTLLHEEPTAALLSSPTAFDVVRGGVRGRHEQMRFRAFRLGRRAGTSTAVLERLDAQVPGLLLQSEEIRRAFGGVEGLVVPRVLSSGTTDWDGRRLDWVAEQLVLGCPVPPDHGQQAATELLRMLGRAWGEAPTPHHRLRPGQRERAGRGLAQLVSDAASSWWPTDVDRTRFRDRAEALLASTASLTHGPSHGDPTLGNLLLTADGRLALLDWELAALRPLAHDVGKVLRSVPDPLALAATLQAPAGLAERIGRLGALPWRQQVAQSLLVFLSDWSERYRRAEQRGRGRQARCGLQLNVRLVDVLAD